MIKSNMMFFILVSLVLLGSNTSQPELQAQVLMVYYLWIAYAPPIKGNNVAAESSYENIVTDILSNFSINIEAPAVWHPLEK